MEIPLTCFKSLRNSFSDPIVHLRALAIFFFFFGMCLRHHFFQQSLRISKNVTLLFKSQYIVPCFLRLELT